ncbi:carbohydrate kinase family protein [Lawsonibacter sp. LCP25S3_G6]|uniref:carbohydrate kinase family protein n=1 Tax=unclassified Lawsonibacter TaxID=2617946 RepID=UPI003F94EBF9
MYDVVALGESLIDFTPSGRNELGMPLFSQNPGGAPANVLAMHAKLGGRTAFIGKVGQDDFGLFLQCSMEQAGIDCSGLQKDAHVPTTLAFVHLDEKGDRSFTFYRDPGADLMLRQEEVPEALLTCCRMFHFGSVSLTGEPCRSTTIWAAQQARKAGALISYDPNYRPFLWEREETAKTVILDALPLVDLLKVSEEEMVLLTGKTDLEQGAAQLLAMGPAAVFVTRGEAGVYFQTPAGSGRVAAFDVRAVDTTGAGDAFLGALLAQIQGRGREALSAMTLSQWQLAARIANAAGGLTTTSKGAIPAMPSAEELREYVQRGTLR